MSHATRTFSAALPTDAAQSGLLAAYATLYGKAARTGHARIERFTRENARCKPEDKRELTKAQRKAELVKQFGLTSRQANAVLVEVDGKRASIIELYDVQLDDARDTLGKRKKQLRRQQELLGEHKKGTTLWLSPARRWQVAKKAFQLKTKVTQLEARIARLKKNQKEQRTELTFGTKDLLRRRFVPADGTPNGPRTAPLAGKALAAWREEWDLARNGQFLVLGSKDETGGCQGCVATAEADGSFTLRLRLPDPVGGGYLTLTGIRFDYGDDRLRYALAQQALRATAKKAVTSKAREAQNQALEAAPLAEGEKKPALKISQKDIEGGTALTWRFIRGAGGTWRVSFTTDVAVPALRSHRLLGAIGVDVNSGFITVAETDRFGNILSSRKIAVPETGRSAGQRAAARGEAVKDVIAQCLRTGKPLVLEKLDFQAKKRDLRVRNPNARRKLSALGYRALHDLFSARALDSGIEVLTINPAYTSTQGLVRYAARRGWSSHQAAAGVIARRGLDMKEQAPVAGMLRMPVGGAFVEFAVPEEIVKSKGLLRWRVVHRHVQEAIASHYQVRRGGVRPATPKLGKQGLLVGSGGIPASKRAIRTPALA